MAAVGGWWMTSQEGGVDGARHRHWYGADNNNGWNLPPPHAAGVKGTDVVMPPFPPTHDKIDYDDKDSGRCHKREGADNNGK